MGLRRAILHLDSQDRRTFVGSMLWAIVLLALSLWLVTTTSAETTPAAAYVAFACGIVLWGGQLLAFYTGFVTGPNKTAYSADATRRSRFVKPSTRVSIMSFQPRRAPWCCSS